LIKYLTQQAEEDIGRKKQELRDANIQVIVVERKLTEDYRKELKGKIKLKKQELEAHSNTHPQEKPKPATAAGTASAEIAEIEHVAENITTLSDKISTIGAEQIELSNAVEELRQIRQAIEREVSALTGLEAKYKATLAAAGLNFNQLV